MRCKPGDLCLVLRSDLNAGRVVTVLSRSEPKEPVPGFPGQTFVSADWFVIAEHGLKVMEIATGRIDVCTHGVFFDRDLLPIRPESTDDQSVTDKHLEHA